MEKEIGTVVWKAYISYLLYGVVQEIKVENGWGMLLNDRYGHIKNKNNVNNGDIGFIIANEVKTEVNPLGTCIKVLFTDGSLIVAHRDNFELYKRCAT